MSNDENNKANEPLEHYQQPLSFDKVWLMFQETDKQFKETDKKFQESERLLTEKFQETDKQFKETDKKFQESDRLLTEKFQKIQAFSDEVGRKIDKLAKLYGGVSENSKDVAEEFFSRGLNTKNELFGIPYTEVGHLEKSIGKLQGEYDIVLYNGDSMIVIEVKYKVHPNDVTDFIERKLPNFKKLFHEYADKKIIGGIAGLSVPNDSFERAKNHGLLVLSQSGENMQVMNEKGFEPKVF